MACRYAGVVGAMDGTQIKIIAPSKDEDVFVNRKKVHSINTQIVFGATFNILDVVAKWPAGSTHDPRILMESSLRQDVALDTLSQSTTGSTVKVSFISRHWRNYRRCNRSSRVDKLNAPLLRGELNIRRESVIRPRIDVAFPDNYLFERYRFTSQSIIYIHNLIRPYICNISNRSHALTSQQILCVALRFFANGSCLYNVGDAEHLSKATACRAVRKVCLAMKRLLPMFVVFPGHKPVRAIKEVLGGGLRG
ncbi:putative nuclease HARBI1 [Merluccius polli]|uniref:Nuclease HARBI1 n=1 Tax=Merluccius polli TaxID=89951 RepID=A0AA47P5V4_MERPO|nr:putative nuclease HARBI1 [Merluccius polli]